MKDIPRFYKIGIAVVIVLIAVPIPFTIHANYFRDIIKIGIVLTNETYRSDGILAVNFLNEYDEYFEATLLPVTFDESDIRVKNNYYLNEDYFDSEFAGMVRDKYDVDIVYIFTDNFINNWLGNGRGYWGQADTKNAMALGTMVHFQNHTLRESYIRHLAVHEVLHLLGYLHEPGDKKCIMQYASLNPELCDESITELPYRADIWSVGYGYESGRGMLLINFTLHLIFSTPIFGIILLSNLIFRRKLYKKEKIDPNPLIFSMFGLIINNLLISTFIYSHYARAVSLISMIFVYLLLESVSYGRYFNVKANEL